MKLVSIGFCYKQKRKQRLIGRHPNHCGYLGFDLSCSPKNHTILNLPTSSSSWKVVITKINYGAQLFSAYDPDGCLVKKYINFNFSASSFQLVASRFSEKNTKIVSGFHDPDTTYYFSCPNSSSYNKFCRVPSISCSPLKPYVVDCASDSNQKVFSVCIYAELNDLPPWPCKSITKISSLHDFSLSWSKPMCGHCESQQKLCRLRKNNNTRHNIVRLETECYGELNQSRGVNQKLLIAGCSLTSLVLLVGVILTCSILNSDKKTRQYQLKVDKFLEDYRALKPSRYSYKDIKKITSNFTTMIGQGGYGTVYKGKLSNDVHVAVKVLNDAKGNGDEFINEVGTMGKIHHVNVVRLVGYCADGSKRALIYEFMMNYSLEKFISFEGKKQSLGWKKLEEIALGIAKGIEYLHQGCDLRILHFDIKPHNVLLDCNFIPKISDFGLAKLCSKEQSAISMTIARGTIGYIAPEVFSRNFGSVSYKSDIYSFGMLLLEIVGGRTKPTEKDDSDAYFPEWIYNRLNRGDELAVEIEHEADENSKKIINKLTIMGLWCIQWFPSNRPSMKVVVQTLEGDGIGLTLPPNPFVSIDPITNKETIGMDSFISSLESESAISVSN
ncbi:rust resistance kinase Lr10-like isoform X2 [Impatiens glandulifera]|uniref:rust resistance kinase Lr10-like isoform X2 n=1 Tax=Impatiens glandulifera TaxID=253017 RepID=UPI001FB15E52|nr:rust resistance kinase Lr10-like isoform X2 [Impatiens glandulifera]